MKKSYVVLKESINKLIKAINEKYGVNSVDELIFRFYPELHDYTDKYIAIFQYDFNKITSDNCKGHLAALPLAIDEYVQGKDIYMPNLMVEFADKHYNDMVCDGINEIVKDIFFQSIQFLTDGFVVEDYYVLNGSKFSQFLIATLLTQNFISIANNWINRASNDESIDSAIWYCELYREICSFDLYADERIEKFRILRNMIQDDFRGNKCLNAKLSKLVVASKKGDVPKKYIDYLMKGINKPSR